MARESLSAGLTLEFDERRFVRLSEESSKRSGTSRPRRSDAFGSAVEVLTPRSERSRAEEIASVLRKKNIVEETSDAIVLDPVRGGKRGNLPSAQPTRLAVEVGGDRQAVVLVEADGLLWWEFGRPTEPQSGQPARRGGKPEQRTLSFFIDAPPASSGKRGLGKMILGGIRAIVLYFAAEMTAKALVDLIDGKRREGPVVIGSATDLTAWSPSDTYAEAVHRPATNGRFLLLLHGTFSSTIGGFGELIATPWGQRFLQAAIERYDAVIGFDHKTVAVQPDVNARKLAAALQTLPKGQGIEIDVVCHSRAGLVLRSLAEQLHDDKSPIRIRRGIFVGATHLGTQLARPKNWESLANLVTNLSSVTARVLKLFPAATLAAEVADETIASIGQFVKYLAQVALEKQEVPGLAAMDPDGEFVKVINEASTIASLADTDCYVITSDFHVKLIGRENDPDSAHEPREFPKRLALALADVAVDRLMKGDQASAVPNDLVVDVKSITATGSAFGDAVKDVLDFGRNPLVYHTNYFLRPETVARLAQWLHLPSPVADIDAYRLAGAQRSILRLPAQANVARARDLAERVKPDYVVVARRHVYHGIRQTFHYAISASELLESTQTRDERETLEQALGLQESNASRDVEFDRAPLDTSGFEGNHPSSRRAVVTDAKGPIAVLDEDSRGADMFALAEMAKELNATAQTQAHDGVQSARVPASLNPAEGWEPVHSDFPTKVRIGSAPGGSEGVSGFENFPGTAGIGWGAKIGGIGADRGGGKRAAPAKKAATSSTKKPKAVEVLPIADTPKTRAPSALKPLHATAQMPGKVALHSTATLTVTLSAEQLTVETFAGAVQIVDMARVDARRRLTVHAIARVGFDYAPGEANKAEVDYPAPGKPQILDFVFKAAEAGDGEITVAVRQGNVRVMTLALKSAIVRDGPLSPRSVVKSATETDEVDAGNVPSLQIYDHRSAGELRYEFFLDTDRIHDRFYSAPIKVNPQTFIADKYQMIEDAWRVTKGQAQQFANQLEAIGARMFRDLFPDKVKKELWRLAKKNDFGGIQIHSDEPFLPWEIVFLDDPDAGGPTGKGRFFGELGLCRWLLGARSATKIILRDGRKKYVIPDYPSSMQLESAGTTEKKMLEQYGFVPVAPDYEDVLALLKGPGAFDALHFACHGAGDSAQIDEAALLLAGDIIDRPDGQTVWAKTSLAATVVDYFANFRSDDGNRPLVMLNACESGKLGFSLTQLGGFATAFLGAREGSGDDLCRAGAFIGTLWSVNDKFASDFAGRLYAELKAGKTIAQASSAARQQARKGGDGTWLAYTIYAHPNLVVNFA